MRLVPVPLGSGLAGGGSAAARAVGLRGHERGGHRRFCEFV